MELIFLSISVYGDGEYCELAEIVCLDVIVVVVKIPNRRHLFFGFVLGGGVHNWHEVLDWSLIVTYRP